MLERENTSGPECWGADGHFSGLCHGDFLAGRLSVGLKFFIGDLKRGAVEYKARLLGMPKIFADGVKAPFPFLTACILTSLLIREGTKSRDRICSLLWEDKLSEEVRGATSAMISVASGVCCPCFRTAGMSSSSGHPD